MTEIALKKYLFSPALDFLLLGGGSLIVLPLVMHAWPAAQIRAYKLYPVFVSVSVFFSYMANFPHFIYSYQILYKDFLKKLNGAIDRPLQGLYIWASIIVPVILALSIAACYVKQDYLLFGFLGNFGLLVSGWHYAKQAFGVLIVTSVYQKIYYTRWERRVLLWNANLLWAFLWIVLNTGLHQRDFWHARVYTLGFPQMAQNILFFVVCLSTLSAIFVLIRKYLRESVFPPLSGLVGYATTLYFWLVLLDVRTPGMLFHPVILLIPSMHAIQYITIVFKMKGNELASQKISAASLVTFIGGGLVLGYLSFVSVPWMLDRAFPFHGALGNSILFVVIFAVFINIHHFFIDNVIWRKENSEVKTYLYEYHV